MGFAFALPILRVLRATLSRKRERGKGRWVSLALYPSYDFFWRGIGHGAPCPYGVLS